ncbi:putative cysteine synthase [Sugiyamaella lignohabitans]|uniref:cysteine synthase n=1 Tax=Sugiyamaella lignohabitans TaxID=796027 RepID=A0A161HFX7_9ASCO|nr:putative cysteine synthase [Sugiyamaella lignohabitans]ANB14540.1 putative cysteine synthase [Sugiyamaella lignohabitans]
MAWDQTRLLAVATLSTALVLGSLWYNDVVTVEIKWPVRGKKGISKMKTGFVAPKGIEQLIGNTPMVRINSLSDATGCEIYGKMEVQNPGGSAKDRVALAIIENAEAQNLITPHSGDMIFEGTSGSTGISLAMLCRAKGYIAHIVVPDDTSQEKVDLLENLGAVVHKVRPAGIADPKQYVNYAKAAAMEINNNPENKHRALFADQFENEANWKTHYDHTGPEIYSQISEVLPKGKTLDAFITGAGTGGTISGVSKYLKERLPHVKVVISDPPGSGFYNKVKYGVMFDLKEKEGTRRRHQVDTVVEGIGLNRITRNFSAGSDYIDDAIRVKDEESVKMAKYLVDNDGLFVGSSSAVNCVATYKYAKQLGPGHTIVTILCDSGSRHLSKFWKLAKESASIKDLSQL